LSLVGDCGGLGLWVGMNWGGGGGERKAGKF